MAKLIKSNYVEYEKAYIINNSEMKQENQAALQTLEFMNKAEKNVDDTKEKDYKINIEKLEQLKTKLQKETDEITKNANELSNQIIEDASLESKKIIEEASIKAQEIFDEKEKEGYKAGYEEALSKYNYLIKDAQNVLNEAEEYKKSAIDNQEKEIVNLILQCVSKIIKKKMSEDDEVVTNIITSSIDDLNSRKKLIVKISREDFEETGMIRNKILAMFPAVQDIEIKFVDSYSKGDIEIESEEGTVNPSIKEQFVKLREEFSKLIEDKKVQD